MREAIFSSIWDRQLCVTFRLESRVSEYVNRSDLVTNIAGWLKRAFVKFTSFLIFSGGEKGARVMEIIVQHLIES